MAVEGASTLLAHRVAAGKGDINYLQGLSRQLFQPCWEMILCLQAAGCGQLRLLQWSQSQHPPWQINAPRCAMFAAERNHQELLGWLLEQFPDCLRGAQVEAAWRGLVATLRSLKAHNPRSPWDSKTLLAAAVRGHMDALEFLCSHNPPCPLDAKLAVAAARRGDFAMLGWLRQLEPLCPIDAYVGRRVGRRHCGSRSSTQGQ